MTYLCTVFVSLQVGRDMCYWEILSLQIPTCGESGRYFCPIKQIAETGTINVSKCHLQWMNLFNCLLYGNVTVLENKRSQDAHHRYIYTVTLSMSNPQIARHYSLEMRVTDCVSAGVIYVLISVIMFSKLCISQLWKVMYPVWESS